MVKSSAQLKIRRAKHHLNTFNAECRKFFRGQPYTLSEEHDSQQGVVRCFVRLDKEPPARFGPILGDFFNNLRSALDYVVTDLTLHTKGRRLTGTGWPVVSDANNWETYERKSGRLARTCGLYKVRGVGPPEALAAIEGLQPYVAGDRAEYHLFSVLHDLTNRDKHHAPNLGVVDAGLAILSRPGPPSFTIMGTDVGVLEKGQTTLLHTHPLDTWEVGMKVYPTLGISLTEEVPASAMLWVPPQERRFNAILGDARSDTLLDWLLYSVVEAVSLLEPFLNQVGIPSRIAVFPIISAPAWRGSRIVG